MSDTDKLIALCDLLSGMIYSNPEHWQTLGFHEFLHDVKAALKVLPLRKGLTDKEKMTLAQCYHTVFQHLHTPET